jgi:ubiquinone/menaquinone biosynthesis C-methylase UbiE
MPVTPRPKKPYVGWPMEGGVARWYAVQRRSGMQMDTYRRQAEEFTAGLCDGAEILEVAPGPGYLAIELARSGRFRVSGLDVSRTFVDLATEAARTAGVDAEFRVGDAAQLPYASDRFDLVVSQAAFKNFSRPADALAEMHRVLRPGGTAVIQDMSREASRAAIAGEVQTMGLGVTSAALTRIILGRLRRRANTPAQFTALVAKSPFGGCEIHTAGIGLEVTMRKQPGPVA